MHRPPSRSITMVVILSLSAIAGCTGTTASPEAPGVAIRSVPAAGAPTGTSGTDGGGRGHGCSDTDWGPERGANPAAYVEGTPYAVTIDPADFVSVIDNPYWPMVPGTTTIFEGGGERIVVEVTDYTKTIMGVPATVVATPPTQGQGHRGHLRLVRAGSRGQRLVPRRGHDGIRGWQAGQHRWLWEAGVDGAIAGHRDAEPIRWSAMSTATSTTRARRRTCPRSSSSAARSRCQPAPTPETIVTEDWTPLEPDQLEHKTYAPGVGIVAEGPVDDPTEVKLVEVRQP